MLNVWMKGCDSFLGIQDTLKALADPIRREILNLLKNGRLSAGEICEHFPVTGASISRHLSVLKEADLIRDKREGKFIYYELNVLKVISTFFWITLFTASISVVRAFCSVSSCFNLNSRVLSWT